MKQKNLLFTLVSLLMLFGMAAQASEQFGRSSQDIDWEYYEERGVDPLAAERLVNAGGESILDFIPPTGILLIPDSGNEKVMAFDPDDGELIDEFFFPGDDVNLTTPIQILWNFTGTSFLVSDQLMWLVQQFDTDGQFEQTFAPAGGQDNTIMQNNRGIYMKPNGNLLVTVAGGGNANSIAMFDTDGEYVGNFIDNNAGGLNGPWSIVHRQGLNDYLVSANGSSGIHRYDADGDFIEMFATGLAFPQQMEELDNGNILVTNFSAPSGVYEFDSEGTQIGYYSVVTALRGVKELFNGNIMVTNSSGVHIINRNNELLETVVSGQARHISHIMPMDLFLPPTNLEIHTDGLGPDEALLTWVGPALAAKFRNANCEAHSQTGLPQRPNKAFLGFNVYLNDNLVAEEITETEYLFTNLPGGENTAGVQTVYTAGESEIVTIDFEVEGEPDLFEVTFNIDITDAVHYGQLFGFDDDEHHIFMTGTMFGWQEPGEPETVMELTSTDPHVYSMTLMLEAGEYEYKYFSDLIGDGWDGGEWEGDPNRMVTITEDTEIHDVFETGDAPGFTLTFEVTDTEGNALEYAIITLGETTYDAGHYVIEDVPMGTWNYLVEKEGYLSVEGQVEVSHDKTVQVTMEVDDVSAPDLAGPDLNIYPNPAHTTVSIQSDTEITLIRIVDILGQVVYTSSGSAHDHEVNVSDLDSGVYFIQLTTETGVITKRLQVTR